VIAGIGVDIMQIGRLEAALQRTPELAARLFTTAERSWAGGRRAPAEALAGSFAAKEALAKVLGAPAGLHWTDAEVVRNEAGRPLLRVRGSVATAAAQQGIGAWHLSLSHDGGPCIAVVVAESVVRDERVPGHDERVPGHDERARGHDERVPLRDELPERRA
jgi:holo-[acyl-carrier protein] synthase